MIDQHKEYQEKVLNGVTKEEIYKKGIPATPSQLFVFAMLGVFYKEELTKESIKIKERIEEIDEEIEKLNINKNQQIEMLKKGGIPINIKEDKIPALRLEKGN